ncbi:uncharacterized protein KZ484_021333 isoform 2-T3 [Pholidichthys leucotaenia]
MSAVKMSSVHHLREFIHQRLATAAEEIFCEVEKTIVQYEEERLRLMENSGNTEIKLLTADLRQHRNCMDDEILSDQQLCIQERISVLHQEIPDPSRIKEEQEEHFPCQKEVGLLLKEETESFMVTSVCEDNDRSKSESSSDTSVSDQEVATTIDAESTVIEVQKMRLRNNRGLSLMSEDPCNSGTSEKSAKCMNSEQALKKQSQMNKRHRIHREFKAITCNLCEEVFSKMGDFLRHMKNHPGEKPYSCNTCEKRFKYAITLKQHMRTHTGEKLCSCEICGKSFIHSSLLSAHMRVHTGEKPYSCEICGKRYRQQGHLIVHRRIHTGEKQYSCEICGKSFSAHSTLKGHMRSHTGERPHECEICGRRFSQKSYLINTHLRTHTGK